MQGDVKERVLNERNIIISKSILPEEKKFRVTVENEYYTFASFDDVEIRFSNGTSTYARVPSVNHCVRTSL